MGSVFSIFTADTLNLCSNFIAPIRNLKRNLKALNDESLELRELRNDVTQEVERAKRRRLEPLNQVQGWLGRTETMIREVEELSNHVPQEIQSLLLEGRFSRNFISTYQYGQKVARKLEEVVEQKRKGVFDNLAENEATYLLDPRPVAPTVGLESTLDKVCKLLEDNKDVGIVGLFGIGGVGKTTLLAQINNRLFSMPTRYDVVIWVVVSKDYFIDKVQDQIGEKIGLSNERWRKKSCDDKATEIFKVLCKRKFVLLLDDLWKRVDLVKVGIPPLNDGSSFKIVFTTRSQDVCGEMEAHDKIRVACLREDEAWKLFRGKVGEQILKSHPEIEELAKRVAAECGGLPLALVTTGRAMACKKSPQEWEYAMEVLQGAAYKFSQLENEVYPLLKFSYDSLPSDTMRLCLLYCSLYPEDQKIDKRCLIDYWFYEGFLDEFGDINRARMQGFNILGSLVNACLLEEIEDGEGESYVKMHHVIRDMTFWIAGGSEVVESGVSIQGGVQLIEALNVGTWEGVKRMCLTVQNQIKYLTTPPKCPKLHTLFLHYNCFWVIHDGFFQFMPNLKVLNLSNNGGLTKLPEGISELVSLECLDLSWTGIEVLPIKLKTLTKLKYLDLWHMPLRINPQQLISSFSKLQIVKIFLRDVWVLEDGNEDLMEEMGCLQHLKSASLMVESVFALKMLLTFRNLEVCTEQLKLCQLTERSFDVLSLAHMEGLKRLDIFDCHMEEMKMKRERVGEAGMTRIPYQLAIDACFHTLGNVRIIRCFELKDVTWLMLAPNLTSLKVESCLTMEEIISGEKLSEVVAMVGNQYPTPFRKLQSLNLRCLTKLKSIYWGALPFPFLKHMFVRDCLNLRKLALNSASAKGNQIIIQGEKEWWEELEWEDESARNAFLPCFTELTGFTFLN